MTRGRRSEKRLWTARRKRLVAGLTFLLLVLAVSTQSATAEQLTPGRLPFTSVVHWFKDLMASAPVAPQQQFGRGATASSTRAGVGAGHAPSMGKGQQAAAPASGAAKAVPGKSAGMHRGFDAKTSVFLASKSTARTSWWQNADGTQTEKLSAAPVNYRTAQGTWAPIDTTLVRGSDGLLHEKANSFGLTLGASVSASPAKTAAVAKAAARANDASVGADSTGQLATLTYGTGESFGWQLSGAAAVTPTTSGETVSYPGILQDTELDLTSESWGVKESLILSAADAPTSWTFPLTETGLTLGQSSGAWQLTDPADAVVATLPAPYAVDANGSRTTDVAYSLATVGGVSQLTMSLDSGWLADASRAFPVTVDPTVSNPGTETAAMISSANPNTNYGTNPGMGVGETQLNSTTLDVQRAYVAYPSGVADTGYHITAAGWTGFMTQGSTASTDPFSIYSVNSPWSASTITASNAPTAYISKLGTYSGLVVSSTSCNGFSGNWIGVTLDANAMSQFATNTYAWNGIWLQADSESNTAYYRVFNTTQVSACSPYLNLTYTPDVAPTLSTMSPLSNKQVFSLTPELTATGTDPDNWPNSAVKFEFYVDSASGAQIAKSGLLSTGSWSIPSGVLKWNNTYQWAVCVWDGWECQSSTLTSNTFYTNTPAPMLTQDLSQATDGHGFEAQTGDYTMSATDADIGGIGPALSVVRDYNSLDNRPGEGFGEGWSSLADATVTQGLGTDGSLVEAGVTYPDGSLVAFGYSSGNYTPPEGRYATLTATTSNNVVTSYTLTDKSGTTYTFGTALTPPVTGQSDPKKDVGGVFGLTQVTDHQGRALDVTWQTVTLSHKVTQAGVLQGTQTGSFYRVGTIQNMASNRELTFEWSWPDEILGQSSGNTGITQPHVYQVVTSDAVSLNDSTHQLWTYGYSGNQLTSVCAPSQSAPNQASTACAGYAYQNGSVYRTAVLDGSPFQFWPMSDVSSATSNFSQGLVGANVGVGPAWYEHLTADTDGPMTPIGSNETGAKFDGSTGYMPLPSGMIVNSTYVSVGLWFKTSAGGTGPLFCEQNQPFGGATTPTTATCSLYVGTDGKLHGAWYNGSTTPITSSSTVNDNKWHFALLSGEGGTQSLYLDGSLVGAPLSGTVQNLAQTYEYVGGGYSSGSWPNMPAAGNWYFHGSIADVAVYKQGVPAAEVSSLYNAATVPSAQLTLATRPSGKTAASVVYDATSGRVNKVVDSNGATWQLSVPSVTGSSQVFASDVLGLQPADYYRFNDTSGSYPTDQVNADAWADAQLAGQYNDVGLGSTSSVFSDGNDAAAFTPTSSYSTSSWVQLPNSLDASAPASIAMWFNAPKGKSGPLYCMQSSPLSATPANATCPLYVGTNGNLYGGFYLGSFSNIASAHAVNDGNWHYVVLSATSSGESLYLDGALVGTASGTFNASGQIVNYVGGGYSSTAWPNTGAKGDWFYTGDISDVAIYRSALSQAQVTGLWQGYENTVGSIVPLETVTVTDPTHTGGSTGTVSGTSTAGTETYAYDPAQGGRAVSYTDPLGGRTTYSYDVNGFLNSVTDPNGDQTITGRDARGNAVSTTTCQLQSQGKCQTSYATYYWSANNLVSTTTNVDADLEVTSSDGRSSNASDPTYETKYGYDGNGNELTVTDPDKDTTTNTYTAASANLACDPAANTPDSKVAPGTKSTTQYAPTGLLNQTTTAGGAVTTYWYYPGGDTCEVKNADGLDTIFTYDQLGRVTSKTVTGDAAVPAASLEQYTETLTTMYTYDGDGRVAETVAPVVTDRVTGAKHTADTVQRFDADGNLTCTSVADDSGGDTTRTTTYTYNSLNQKVSETAPEGNSPTVCPSTGTVVPDELDGQNHTTTYTYDLFGNVQTQTDPQNRQTQYLYDAGNRLVTTEDLNTNTDGTAKSGANLVTDSRSYDAGGRLAQETNAAGYATCYLYYDDNLIAETVKIDTKVITACPASESQASTDAADGTNAFIQAQDSYDGAGNLTTAVSKNGATTTDYAFDNAGRRTATTVDPSGLDRVTTDTYFPDGYVKEAKLTAPGSSGTTFSDVSYTYTPLGEQYSQSTANGSSTLTTTVKRDERGLPYMSTDANGNNSYTTYDEAGRLALTQSPQVSATSYSTSTMSATTNTPAYSVASTGYDTFGDTVETEAANSPDAPTSIATATGIASATADSTLYTYDADGNQTSVTRPSYTASTGGPALPASTAVVQYNGDGEVIETVDPIAYASYIASGASKTFGAGEVVTNNYNQFGEVSSSTTTDYNNAGATATTSYTYNPDGTTASTTDPTGAKIERTYDYLGRTATGTQIERSRTDGTSGTADYTTDYSYGPGGWVSEVQSPDNVASSSQGTAVSYAYDAAGETTQVTDAAGDKTLYGYDGAGRAVKTTRPDGSYTTATYDEAGRETGTAAYNASSVEQTWTQSLYDSDGNMLCAETPVSGTATSSLPTPPTATQITTSNYTSACAVSSSWALTQYQYDATGLVTQETQPVDATAGTSITVSYGYDLNGNKTAYTDGNGNASGNTAANTTYTTYNAWQQPETTIEPTTATYTSPAARETTTTYNADGEPRQVTEPGGVTLGYSYYGNGELAQETGGSATATTATRSFTYYPNGALETAATSNTLSTGSNATSESFTYDDRGDLLTTSGNSGTLNAGSSSFYYNGDSLLTSAGNTIGTGAQTTGYTYDNADRLATLTDGATGTTLSYAYYPASDKQTVTYGSSGDVRTLQYNAVGEPVSDTLATASGATVKALTYGWDVDGNLTSKTDASGTANAYTYDQADRLTSWTKGSATSAYPGTGTCATSSTLICYAYDADSNRTRVGSNVYTYDSRDELTSDGVTSYSYTANGDLVGKQTSSGTTTNYTDDAYGQQATAGVEQYTYDAAGRMLTETNPGTGGSITALTYQGAGNQVASDGTNSYTRTPTGSLVGAKTASGTSLLWTDLHTDVVGAFSPTSAALAGTETYDPLGNVLANSGTTANLTVGYQSEYTDAKTGEVNMAARWYNPATGQFLNKDTATNSATPNTANANPFAYGNSNPLTGTDPTGHDDLNDVFGCSITSIRCREAVNQYDPAPAVVIQTMEISVAEYDIGQVQDQLNTLNQLEPHFTALPRAVQATPAPQAGASPSPNVKPNTKTPSSSNLSQPAPLLGADRYTGSGPEPCGASCWLQILSGVLPLLFGDPEVTAVEVADPELALGMEDGASLLEAADSYSAEMALGSREISEAQSLMRTLDEEQSLLKAEQARLADDLNPTDAAQKTTPKPGTGSGNGAKLSTSDGSTVKAPSSGAKILNDVTQAVSAPGPAAEASAASAEKIAATALEPSQTADLSPIASKTDVVDAGTDNPLSGCTDGAVPPVPHSFTGSTGVLMANGAVKPIDQVKVGDEITDSVPGQETSQSNTVTAVIVTHTDHDFVNLTVAPETTDTATKAPLTSAKSSHAKSTVPAKLTKTKKAIVRLAAAAAALVGTVGLTTHAIDNASTLTTTYHHPFYDITQQAFVDAQHLKPGDQLQTTTGRAEVTDVHLFHADTTTYDLTIAELHTYYVAAGSVAVLVHNDGCGIARHAPTCQCRSGNGSEPLGVSPSPGNVVVLGKQSVGDALAEATEGGMTFNAGPNDRLYGYTHGGVQPQWVTEVNRALQNPNISIRVDLGGDLLNDPSFTDPSDIFWEAVSRGKANGWRNGPGTQWEMSRIALFAADGGPHQLDGIEWFMNGMPIDPPSLPGS